MRAEIHSVKSQADEALKSQAEILEARAEQWADEQLGALKSQASVEISEERQRTQLTGAAYSQAEERARQLEAENLAVKQQVQEVVEV